MSLTFQDTPKPCRKCTIARGLCPFFVFQPSKEQPSHTLRGPLQCDELLLSLLQIPHLAITVIFIRNHSVIFTSSLPVLPFHMSRRTQDHFWNLQGREGPYQPRPQFHNPICQCMITISKVLIAIDNSLNLDPWSQDRPQANIRGRAAASRGLAASAVPRKAYSPP